MKYGNAVILGLMWILLSLSDVRGQETADSAKPQIHPEIGIRLEANPKVATIGDPIQLDLDVAVPPNHTVEIARPVAQTSDYSIIDFSSAQDSLAANKQPESPKHCRARITAAIYKTGKFAFPPILLKVKTGQGKEITVSSPSVSIEIRSVLTEKDRALKDLKKQAEIPESVRWLLWITLIAAGCVIGAIGWYFWRRRRIRPVLLTPDQARNLLDIAETDLRNLLARGLPNSGMEKQFYIAISQIVKRILEAGYRVRTAEQTTSEIMDALQKGQALDAAKSESIESFLVRCDVVKFAKYVPAKNEHETISQDALRILAGVREAVSSRE